MTAKTPCALIVLIALAGCGTSSNTPKPASDTRPRVEGKWRVRYTETRGEAARTTWNVTPKCGAGACSFTANSSSKTTLPFRFDKAIGDYTSRYTFKTDCVDEVSGRTLVKNAFKVHQQINTEVSRVITTDGRKYATEMTGTRSFRPTVLPIGAKEDCPAAPTVETQSVRAVRIDPPPGRTTPFDPEGSS